MPPTTVTLVADGNYLWLACYYNWLVVRYDAGSCRHKFISNGCQARPRIAMWVCRVWPDHSRCTRVADIQSEIRVRRTT